MLGQAHRAAAALKQVALAALQSSGANPTFLPANARRRARSASTGFFHDSQVPQALDQIAGSWVDLSALAHRHAVKLHRGTVSHLPDRLLPEGADLWSGASTTYLEFVPNDFLDEMRRLAQPTLLSAAEPGASLQDDISSTAFPAWRAETRVSVLHRPGHGGARSGGEPGPAPAQGARASGPPPIPRSGSGNLSACHRTQTPRRRLRTSRRSVQPLLRRRRGILRRGAGAEESAPVSVTLNSRRDFTLRNLERVALRGESVQIGSKARHRMRETRASFMSLLESDRTRFIYGNNLR